MGRAAIANPGSARGGREAPPIAANLQNGTDLSDGPPLSLLVQRLAGQAKASLGPLDGRIPLVLEPLLQLLVGLFLDLFGGSGTSPLGSFVCVRRLDIRFVISETRHLFVSL